MINIKVNIAGRNYPLSIEPSTEQQVKNAAFFINNKVDTHKKDFNVEMQDALSMCALELGTEMLTLQKNQLKAGEIEAEIDEICRMLSK